MTAAKSFGTLIAGAVLGLSPAGLAAHASPAPVLGSYLVVDIDAWGERSAEIERDRADLMRTLDGSGVAYTDPQLVGPIITLRLNDPGQFERAKRALQSFDINEIKADVTLQPDGRVKVVVPSAWVMPGGGADLDAAVDRVIDRAQARGLAEPDIVDLTARRVRLDFKGVPDADLMRLMRQPQPQLTIQLVDQKASVDAAHAGQVPAGDELAPSDLANEPFLVLRRQVLLSGDEVADAQDGEDGRGRPAVVMRFNQKGADLFAQVTRTHMGERFAVTVNGRVIFAPVIGSQVTDGIGQISGDFTAEGAKGLAQVIRSAAPLTPMVVEDGPLPYRDARMGPR